MVRNSDKNAAQSDVIETPYDMHPNDLEEIPIITLRLLHKNEGDAVQTAPLRRRVNLPVILEESSSYDSDVERYLSGRHLTIDGEEGEEGEEGGEREERGEGEEENDGEKVEIGFRDREGRWKGRFEREWEDRDERRGKRGEKRGEERRGEIGEKKWYTKFVNFFCGRSQKQIIRERGELSPVMSPRNIIFFHPIKMKEDIFLKSGESSRRNRRRKKKNKRKETGQTKSVGSPVSDNSFFDDQAEPEVCFFHNKINPSPASANASIEQITFLSVVPPKGDTPIP